MDTVAGLFFRAR